MERSFTSHNLEHNLLAFNHLQQYAREYNKAEYKFYKYGFFKYVKEDSVFFIEEIYVVPEFRGTPVATDIMIAFFEFMQKENIFMYYGKVMKEDKYYKKRLNTFKRWGMETVSDNDLYTTVSKMIVKEGLTEE